MASATHGRAFAQSVRALCKRNWWVFLVGGAASVIFGLLAFVMPGIALLVLATLFAVSLLIDGAANAYAGVTNRDKDGWWLLLLMGALGIAVGIYALLNPEISMIAFVYTVAIAAVFLGGLGLALGFKIRKETEREWILYLTGAVSIAFGLLIFLQPLAGAVSVVYIIAMWAIAVGVLKIVFAFKVKSIREGIGERRQMTA